MSNRTAVAICAAVILSIAVLAAASPYVVRSTRSGSPVTTSSVPDEPSIPPIPSTPDTAAPTVPTEPSTTTTLPVTPRYTTTTTVEPEVQGTSVARSEGTVSLDDPDMGEWRAIALCEMPGPGGIPAEPWGAHWSFVGGSFSGALGIANTTWRAFGGTEFGPTAGHASWTDQIIIARRIRDAHGYGAWGCGR